MVNWVVRSYYFLRLMFSIWHEENWATPWSGKTTTFWEAFQCAKIVWLED